MHLPLLCGNGGSSLDIKDSRTLSVQHFASIMRAVSIVPDGHVETLIWSWC